MSIDELIGERVHQAMWRKRAQQIDVAPAAGMDQSTLSRKIRGKRPWSVEDVYTVAAVLEIDPSVLLPDPNEVRDLVATPALTSQNGPVESACSWRSGTVIDFPTMRIPRRLAHTA